MSDFVGDREALANKGFIGVVLNDWQAIGYLDDAAFVHPHVGLHVNTHRCRDLLHVDREFSIPVGIKSFGGVGHSGLLANKG